MTDPLDLDALEAVARAATPGPWRTGWDGQEFYVIPESSTDLWDRVAEFTFAIYPGSSDQQDECDTANAKHIAAFDPATVLALIERVREAEARVAFAAAIVSGDATFDRYAELDAAKATIERVREALRDPYKRASLQNALDVLAKVDSALGGDQ